MALAVGQLGHGFLQEAHADRALLALGELGFLATRADFLINWGRKNSLWPMPLGLSCCGIELMATAASRYDIARFGAEAIRFSPRQSDLLICAGIVNAKMSPILKTIYDQMSEPKWVMSFGACASSGGVFPVYSVTQGIDKIIPVDIYIPGCPPSPESVLDGLLKLRDLVQKGDTHSLCRIRERRPAEA